MSGRKKRSDTAIDNMDIHDPAPMITQIKYEDDPNALDYHRFFHTHGYETLEANKKMVELERDQDFQNVMSQTIFKLNKMKGIKNKTLSKLSEYDEQLTQDRGMRGTISGR